MVLAAVRVGPATSGFQLFVPRDPAASPAEQVRRATTVAQRLLDTARERLAASGLGVPTG